MRKEWGPGSQKGLRLPAERQQQSWLMGQWKVSGRWRYTSSDQKHFVTKFFEQDSCWECYELATVPISLWHWADSTVRSEWKSTSHKATAEKKTKQRKYHLSPQCLLSLRTCSPSPTRTLQRNLQHVWYLTVECFLHPDATECVSAAATHMNCSERLIYSCWRKTANLINTQLLLHWFTNYYAGEIVITIMTFLSFYIMMLIYFVIEWVYFLNTQ